MGGGVVLLEPDLTSRAASGRGYGHRDHGSDKQGAKDLHDLEIRRGAEESYARRFDMTTITMGTRNIPAVNAASRGLLLRICRWNLKIPFRIKG
jgi:hypothetical protein